MSSRTPYSDFVAANETQNLSATNATQIATKLTGTSAGVAVNVVEGNHTTSSSSETALRLKLVNKVQYCEMKSGSSGGGMEFTVRGATNALSRAMFGYTNGSGMYSYLDNATLGNSSTGYSAVCRILSSVPNHNGEIYTSAGQLSDDRTKFNETSMSSETAVNLIQQLQIKDYQKVRQIMSPAQEATFTAGGDGFAEYKLEADTYKNPHSWFEPHREFGVIAQQVPPDLSFIVSPGDATNPYRVKYDNLISLNTRVIQHLLEEITSLKARVAVLETHD